MNMLLAVLSVFVLAAFAPLLQRALKDATHWLLALLPLGLFAYFLTFLPPIRAGEVISTAYPWFPSFGINFTFYLDGLSLLFALLVTGFGALIVLYAGGYLKGDPQIGRFYLFLLSFMASMLGLVISSNIITLFVFWELTSLTSYFLIGYKHTYESARKAALQALLVTALGGLALLAGLILMSIATGSRELSEILTMGDTLRDSALYLPILILVVLGGFTKSAQFPFHYWLPNAMEAPTPVSAYLHSATMVKAGIYLFARLSPVMAGTLPWTLILTTFGAITILGAAALALKQTDLKRILAYLTVIVLGTLTLMLGVGGQAAVKAAMVFLLAHSLYKAALFMAAGSVDHEAGSRDVREVAGLWRVMPVTFVATVIAGLSMAGLPPMVGFIGKELIYEGLLDNIVLLVAMVVTNVGLFAATFVIIIRPFIARAVKAPKTPHEAPVSMLIGPILLSLTGLAFGLYPALIEVPIMEPAVAAVLGAPYDFSLHLFPSTFTEPLILSIVTVALGIVLYLFWTRTQAALASLDPKLDVGPAKWYERSLDLLTWTADTQTRLIQTGNLRYDIGAVFAVAFVMAGLTMLFKGGFDAVFIAPQAFFYEWALAVVMLAAAFAAVRTKSRLTAVVALGAVGFSVALVFVLFGAPDLAITQFLVETLVVIIIALVMIHLPSFRLDEEPDASTRWRDGIIAGISGLVITLIMLTVISQPFDRTLSAYFEAQSVPGGEGHNIVNVILVDFRAIDTLGEITVLAVAAIGILALLKLRSGQDSPQKEAS
ncbi:MAG: putative monovalent cation/H+ antiporter subunit A [Trueperaceae bacterium]|nr:putative monovalent cation/H+ antiporter subunit A [Trueperaceae bacterium]